MDCHGQSFGKKLANCTQQIVSAMIRAITRWKYSLFILFTCYYYCKYFQWLIYITVNSVIFKVVDYYQTNLVKTEQWIWFLVWPNLSFKLNQQQTNFFSVFCSFSAIPVTNFFANFKVWNKRTGAGTGASSWPKMQKINAFPNVNFTPCSLSHCRIRAHVTHENSNTNKINCCAQYCLPV